MEAFHSYKDACKVLTDLKPTDSFDNVTIIKIAAAIKSINSALQNSDKTLNNIKPVFMSVYSHLEYVEKYSDVTQNFHRARCEFKEWNDKIDSPNFFDLLSVDHVKSASIIFENSFRNGMNSAVFEKVVGYIKDGCKMIDDFYEHKAHITKLYVVGNLESSKEAFFHLNENWRYKEFNIVRYNEDEEEFIVAEYTLEQYDGTNFYPSSNNANIALKIVLEKRDKFTSQVDYLQKYYPEYLV